MSLPQETMMELMAYADGELDGAARARVEALVKTSDEARRVLEAMGALGDVVREGIDERASSAGVDGIADHVMGSIEREAPTEKGSRIVVPIAQARAAKASGAKVAFALAAFTLAAATVLYIRASAPAPGLVADGTSHETPPVVQPTAPSSSDLPPPAPSAVAEAEPQGVDLEEVSSTHNKVNVFFMPSAATAGAVASVVVWIDDRHSPTRGLK